MNPRNPVNGATYLTLGIISLVLCLPLGPVAWSMSSNALKVLDRYERQTGDYSQRGMVVAGRVCGMIGTAFFCLALLVLLARGCGQSGPSSSPYGGPGETTVTVGGKPVSGEEKDFCGKSSKSRRASQVLSRRQCRNSLTRQRATSFGGMVQ